MPIYYQTMITRNDLKSNPEVLFIFGDCDSRSGFGGQAKEMRGEPNAVGVRTKNKPSREFDAYWSDKTLETNCMKIEEDLSRIKSHLRRGGLVVIPRFGIGTGLSEMKTHCPKTYYILEQTINSLHLIGKE